jgi:hypothetical protein
VRLHRTRLRLDRAEAHRNEFGRIWNDFLTEGHGQPYETTVRVDPTGHGSIRVEPIGFPADDLALEFGEFLYQLRAAMDSLIYETAVVVSGQDPPPHERDLEFPIRATKASFDSDARKIAPLAPHHKVWIEQYQPYCRDQESEGVALAGAVLEIVNDLARKDRHRSLRVVASWGANKDPQFELPGQCVLEWVNVTEDGLLEHQSEITTFKIANWKRGLGLRANPNLTLDVTVEDVEPPAADEDTLAARTHDWIAILGILVEGFEESLEGDPRTLS